MRCHHPLFLLLIPVTIALVVAPVCELCLDLVPELSLRTQHGQLQICRSVPSGSATQCSSLFGYTH